METNLMRDDRLEGRGMILGKFMPPHRGHQFLIDFACRYVKQLTVLVCSIDADPIPGDLRYQWVCEMFPRQDVRIVHITEALPQEPSEHADFWAIWRRAVTQAVGESIDFVFASEDYGPKLAETLDAQFVPVDPRRELRPISGTLIRDNPLAHWEMLPMCVRPYYLKRVCIVGPESTGKSTLAQELAQHFGTVYAWEYARTLLNLKDGRCDPDDIERIALGQLATEDAMARQANRVLICDTNLLLTTIWSEVLFGSCPDWIYEAARSRRYDVTLLLDVDVPWVDDDQRYFPEREKRVAFLDRCRSILDREAIEYSFIQGDWPQRLGQSIGEVNRIL